MRGRLIFAFLAEIYRFDTAAQSDVSLEGGYDPDFKEPRLVDVDGDGIDDRLRSEMKPVRVPCQVEPKKFEELQMTAMGDSPRTDLTLVFHFRDLERMGLVDPQTGTALIRPNDRLGGLYELGGRLVESYRHPPGLFVTEAQPRGFGLNMSRPRRNLLVVRFEARRLAPQRIP